MSHRPLITVALFLVLPCSPLAAEEVAAELRAAEIAFAASVAEKDAAAFASFIDEDAIFLGATALRGREAIVQGWSAFLTEGGPELTWQPETVEVRPDGLGLSRGPYTLKVTGTDGTQSTSSGVFMSIWRRQPEGGWKIVFDSGCPPSAAGSPGGG